MPTSIIVEVIYECLISYMAPEIIPAQLQSNAQTPMTKERKRIKLTSNVDKPPSFQTFLHELSTQCGLREEAAKHGLGENIDIKVARLQRLREGTKAYMISTEAGWQLERPLLQNADSSVQGKHRCDCE
ncbi:MAG: hypothetical protein ABW185_10705 [Sedimenticola sp.]